MSIFSEKMKQKDVYHNFKCLWVIKIWKKRKNCRKKIKDKNEEEGKAFRVRYRKYGIIENVYRFDTRDYRAIFKTGFKTWPKWSKPNFAYYIVSKFINSRGQPLDYNWWLSKSSV